MPAPAGTKRVRGVSVHRPFAVYGTEAVPFDPNNKPAKVAQDHTHKWKVFVRGINNEDISYWVKKVQFKLHETYANSVRVVEEPPFEVEETGWGEFEIVIKLFFAPESNEKPQQIYHGLKLHPYDGDIEAKKARREMVKSTCYEEVQFNEPVEQFYEILTGGVPVRGKGKGSKQQKVGLTAEIPENITPNNVYSREEESRELNRLDEAISTVKKMVSEETEKMKAEEEKLAELRQTEPVLPPPKKVK
ncbi:MAG: hypothetical protein Q9227_003168 [Pyrenula ochraceoflavens]